MEPPDILNVDYCNVVRAWNFMFTANCGRYMKTGGTSFASPHAVAVAANALVALQALAGMIHVC